MPSMIPHHIQQLIDQAHQDHQRLTLVTGVFDLLHDEHRQFLQKAKHTGDILIVAIESDVRVKLLKGEDRPIWNQQRRLKALEQLPEVSAVFILPEDFSKPIHHQQLIAEIRPHVLAVSSHSPHLDKKRAILAQYGGEVRVVHDHNPDISTTILLSQQQ